MDIRTLVENLIQSGNFQAVMNNPLAQFGMAPRQYMGATILPEKTVPVNRFVEEGIRYRTVIANAGTRYSPVQIKQGVLTGSFEVSLGNSDIGAEFNGSDYDALIRLIQNFQGVGSQPAPQAVMNMIQWSDKNLNAPLVEHNEKNRWQAITDAQVTLTGDNGFVDTVQYSDPPGHRVLAGGQWSNNTYNPYPDIINRAQFLMGKGYRITRQITTTRALQIFANNLQVRTQIGLVSVLGGVVTGLAGAATRSQINARFAEDELPPIETYDLQYLTQTSYGPFLRRDAWIFLCETGRDTNIDRADLEPVTVFNTLGYMAVGVPTGQPTPGRYSIVTPFNNKPPRVEGEAWQTSLPVITEPEAIAVITGIR